VYPLKASHLFYFGIQFFTYEYAWRGYIPFAFLSIDACRPQIFVE